MKASFGPFEFDSATRELRRNGDIVKLQSQPAQVLAVLVEHAGEVVTRDALRQAVWGGDTFVDFDKGLNFAIAQVRTALGDSADAPTYIRTFPKRGYQFIAPVERELRRQVAQGFLGPPKHAAREGGSPAEPRSPNRLRQGFGGRKGLRHILLPLSAVLVVGLLGTAVWRVVRPNGNPSHTIAVARFDNQTGLADYDRYAQDVTDSLVAELTQSATGRFAIIGNAAMLRAPRDRRDLVAIGDALKAGYIVLGQIQREGEKVRVLAHLIRLPEQKHLWVTRVEAIPAELTPPAGLAERISREFLGKL
jgi:DNA-binding winged helix-turn-helix (wHTH) protein/TolB-like protein